MRMRPFPTSSLQRRASHALGHRTLLLHDLDQNIGGDPADRVLLQPEFAQCDTETGLGVWDPGECIVPPCPGSSPSLGPGFRSIFWDVAGELSKQWTIFE